MENKPTKNIVLSSLFWKLMERSGTQGIQFIIQIVLARLLVPEQFGTIAIVTVFISLARVFIESGLGTALIQKKETDELDFSSVFYLGLVISTLLYIIIYFSSPLVANFYKDPILTPVLRVMSITLFFGSFISIQNAYISKYMMFKKLFISSLVSIVISGVLGVIMAYKGYGVWALVTQQLLNQLLIAIILFFVVKWHPKLIFSFSRVKVLFSFGWKLLASSLIDILYINLRTLVIGRIYSPLVLGYYNRGEQFPQIIVSNINGSIQSVLLPTMSAYQENTKRIKDLMRRAIVSSSLIVFPMMIGMFVVAEPLVQVVLTEKWLSSVPFLKIFSLSYILMPIHTANLQAINAMGRSDIFLRLEVIKKVVGIAILLISIQFGVYSIAIGMLISGVISSFINSYPNKYLLDYGYIEQLKDILPSLLLSILMGIIIDMIKYLSLSVGLLLIIQIITGVFVYIFLAKLFKLESFEYVLDTLKQLISSNKNSM